MFVTLHVMITTQYVCRVLSVCMTFIHSFVVRYKDINKQRAAFATHKHTQ